MGQKENEATTRLFFTEIWSKGDTHTIDEIIDPHFSFILSFARTDDIESFKRLVAFNRTVFEDLTYVPNEVVADGTKSACWWTITAKHVGTWRNVPGTNKNVSIEGLTFFWFTPQGKLAKAVVENDVMGLMTQIGGIKLVYDK